MNDKKPEDVTVAELEGCFSPEFNSRIWDILEAVEAGQITVEGAYEDVLRITVPEAGKTLK